MAVEIISTPWSSRLEYRPLSAASFKPFGAVGQSDRNFCSRIEPVAQIQSITFAWANQADAGARQVSCWRQPAQAGRERAVESRPLWTEPLSRGLLKGYASILAGGPVKSRRRGCFAAASLENEGRGAQADEAARENAQTEHGKTVDAERQAEVGGCCGRLQFAFGLVEVH